MNKEIFLIVGESGSGKTTITEKLEEKYGLKSIQSYCTRLPRYNGETGHIFVTDEEFDKLTDMVAYTKFNNYRYCATSEQVETHDLYIIDPKGVNYFREHYKGDKNIKVIYISSDLVARYERMKNRAKNNGDIYLKAVKSALNRITNDVIEFKSYNDGTADIDRVFYNNMNDDIDAVTDKIYEYIKSCERW